VAVSLCAPVTIFFGVVYKHEIAKEMCLTLSLSIVCVCVCVCVCVWLGNCSIIKWFQILI
jgi:hypothetical protein